MPIGVYQYPLNQSDKEMAVDPVEPTPESVAGTNIPYRGLDVHGVTDPDADYNVDHPHFEDEAATVDYVPLDDTKPVKVAIVDETNRPFVDWSGRRWPINDGSAGSQGAQRICGRRNSRVSVTLVNHSTTNSVYLDSENNVNATFGAQLAPGASVTLAATTGEIFAICDTGQTATVSVFEEFAVDEGDE